MNSPAQQLQSNFEAQLRTTRSDEERMVVMLEEAQQLLAQEYEETVKLHLTKLEQLSQRETAAEQRLEELMAIVDQQASAGKSSMIAAATSPLETRVEAALEQAKRGNSRKATFEQRLVCGLPLLAIFDEVDSAPAADEEEEFALAQLLEKLAEGLSELKIHEFAITPQVGVDPQLALLLRKESGEIERGGIVRETLRNGFNVEDDEGRPVCLRKAVVATEASTLVAAAAR